MTSLAVSDVGPMYGMAVYNSEEIGGPTPLALNTEWLLANGLGGFAMGSVSGCATRRYHGLLISAARPPVDRINTLAGMCETIRLGGREYRLDCHEFLSTEHLHTTFHPHGFQYLHRFERMPSRVRWHYRAGPLEIVKELRLVWRRPAAVLSYTIAGGDAVSADTLSLELVPLLAMRDFHQQRRADWGDPFEISVRGRPGCSEVEVHAGAPTPLYMQAEEAQFTLQRDWWYGFHRRRERERGQDDIEDLFTPGIFRWMLNGSQEPPCAKLYIATEPIDAAALEEDDGRAAHVSRCIAHVKGQLNASASGASGGEEERVAGLVAAADDFVASRAAAGRESRTIIAGYPWFSDWGRDTMISLPGLLLCTGRLEEAGQTLITYARHIRHGLVPNRFDDYGGEPHYNTADASLWFIHAALEFLGAGGSRAIWRDVLGPACREIIKAYQQGTDGPVGMDGDGLIYGGDPQSQLTWMDAKRDGVAFTPRHGKCVELNALWHRALSGCAAVIREDDPRTAQDCATLAGEVAEAFGETFWSDELGYLYDHINEDGADRSLRPNQVFAVSLPGGLLPRGQQQAVMRIVREKLLTPMGLRTLPRDDPNYHGRHMGPMFERDRAYHQGTVWAWLIGPYVEGWLRAFDFSDASREHGREALRPLLSELKRHSIGQLHEIYDGDEPHTPRGCIAQAWSVAEVLRAMLLLAQKNGD